jgi:hypothetical protein
MFRKEAPVDKYGPEFRVPINPSAPKGEPKDETTHAQKKIAGVINRVVEESGVEPPWEKNVEPMPIITLTNGLRIGNHSSPHPFQFEDDSILPGCSPGRANSFKLIPLEENCPSPCQRWTDIDLSFAITAESQQAIIADAANPEVDVILVALPVLIQVREHSWFADDNVRRKVRCIRKVDRVSQRIHIDKFCV